MQGGLWTGDIVGTNLPHKRRPLILLACMAASFMAAVEATIMTTVMPSIATDLGGFDLFAWAFSSYMLAQATTIPVFGRLADIYGRRIVFFIAASVFLIGSAFCSLASSMLQLAIFRTIQGIGAGGVQPIANTIVGDIYTPVERAKLQGLLSSVFGFAALIGPPLGAVLGRHGNWPIVFWVNIPIGIAAMAMIALFLPQHSERRLGTVNYQSAALLLLCVGSLIFLLNHRDKLNNIGILATVGVISLSSVALVVWERGLRNPLLPFDLWRDRVIAVSGLGALVTGMLMMGVTVYLPTYVQVVMGRGADLSAGILALMSVIWVLGSTIAGICLSRISYRRTAGVGATALVAGTSVLATLTPTCGPAWAALGVLLVGWGMGFSNTTSMIAAQTSVPWHLRGAATSSTMFLRFLGQSLGAAVFGIWLDAAALQQLWSRIGAGQKMNLMTAGPNSLLETINAGMHRGYLLACLWAIVALGLALSYPTRRGPARQT